VNSARAAIESYHDLLGDEIAEESWEQMGRQLRSRGLYFGDRPLCTVLRPRWLSPERYRAVQSRCAALLGAFDAAHRRAVADARFRAQFALEGWEERTVTLDPGFASPTPTSRLDAFLADDGGMWLTEYNAETPAGAGYNDVLTELFLGLPVMRAFLKRWELRPLPVSHSVMHCLVDAFRQWMGSREAPRVAILDWPDVPTYSEFEIFAAYFREHGIPCAIVDPREVEYRDGELRAGDFHITLIYKRVLLSELVRDGGEDHPALRAVRDGAACMVNPLPCKILHKKTSLAVLSDERNRGVFTAEQRAAIAAHIPWTRRVEERRTTHEGREVDLLAFIAEHRDRLVLKPSDEYGGKGIVLGWEASAEEWERAMRAALSEPYIVQERIRLPSEPYPSMVDGRVVIADRMLDTAPYAFHGAYVDGCLTRLATTALLNVTAGGGSNVPTLLVEPRA
jgi:hypothetical protein